MIVVAMLQVFREAFLFSGLRGRVGGAWRGRFGSDDAVDAHLRFLGPERASEG